MSPRVFDSFMAALIRIGLLLALVILLIAEKSQAQGSVVNLAGHSAGSAISISAR